MSLISIRHRIRARRNADSHYVVVDGVERNLGEVLSGGTALPTGGATGEVLAKKTNTNGDVEWIELPDAGSTLEVAIGEEEPEEVTRLNLGGSISGTITEGVASLSVTVDTTPQIAREWDAEETYPAGSVVKSGGQLYRTATVVAPEGLAPSVTANAIGELTITTIEDGDPSGDVVYGFVTTFDEGVTSGYIYRSANSNVNPYNGANIGSGLLIDDNAGYAAWEEGFGGGYFALPYGSEELGYADVDGDWDDFTITIPEDLAVYDGFNGYDLAPGPITLWDIPQSPWEAFMPPLSITGPGDMTGADAVQIESRLNELTEVVLAYGLAADDRSTE